jgi:hypothetical protein
MRGCPKLSGDDDGGAGGKLSAVRLGSCDSRLSTKVFTRKNRMSWATVMIRDKSHKC